MWEELPELAGKLSILGFPALAVLAWGLAQCPPGSMGWTFWQGSTVFTSAQKLFLTNPCFRLQPTCLSWEVSPNWVRLGWQKFGICPDSLLPEIQPFTREFWVTDTVSLHQALSVQEKLGSSISSRSLEANGVVPTVWAVNRRNLDEAGACGRKIPKSRAAQEGQGPVQVWE